MTSPGQTSPPQDGDETSPPQDGDGTSPPQDGDGVWVTEVVSARALPSRCVPLHAGTSDEIGASEVAGAGEEGGGGGGGGGQVEVFWFSRAALGAGMSEALRLAEARVPT